MNVAVVDLIKVRKRSGRIVDFDPNKIYNAIYGAFREYFEQVNGEYTKEIAKVKHAVVNIIQGKANGIPIDIELIQDMVENQLMSQGYYDIAKLYILYRDKRRSLRENRLSPDANAFADLVTLTKYSRYDDKLKRREVFSEIVDRDKNMHLQRYPQLKEEISWAFSFVYDKKVLPSMRSMQYAGKAIEANNARIYNCSFSPCNRPRFFQELFWLLLSGVGVGYSIQYDHIEQIPPLAVSINYNRVKHYVIDDSIEGWADALGALIQSYLKGYYIEFSYHKIRKKGSLLKTAGGRAPGHIPLKSALDRTRNILEQALGRQLRPLECHEIACFAADAVLAGGNRESAMIAIFSPEDGEMVNAKTGDWYKNYPWRSRANNSAALLRNEIKKSQFKRLFKRIKEWGEPGFIFLDDPDIGYNPCVEISLKGSYIVENEEDANRIKNKYGVKVKSGSIHFGYQFCNLTEINAAAAKTSEDLYQMAKAAAIIGTCQAGFTNFDYLGWVSQEITRREALLGVSMTGIMDNPKIALDSEIQRRAAKMVVETNQMIADKIGINHAARCTCIKPAGSTSVIMGPAVGSGSIGSGIHPHHASRYFRRKKCNKMDAVFKFFAKHNPEMVESYNTENDYLVFCIESPDGAITKSQIGALGFLEKVLSTQKNWVIPGTARPDSLLGACHNVSNTVHVREHEWDDVMEFVWKNRKFFSGISFIPFDGDKKYKGAPFEAVITDEDEIKWNRIVSNYQLVDYTKMIEKNDNTKFSGVIACSGNSCELI